MLSWLVPGAAACTIFAQKCATVVGATVTTMVSADVKGYYGLVNEYVMPHARALMAALRTADQSGDGLVSVLQLQTSL